MVNLLRTLLGLSFIFGASSSARAEGGLDGSGPQRVRLTETSITETGQLSGIANEALTTKGYGFGYISPWQVGGAYTCLHTYNRGGATNLDLRHCYIDASYTATLTDWLLLTAGAGDGVAGNASLTTAGRKSTSSSFRGTSLFLGPGFTIGGFEIYWIYRRNWDSYEINQKRDSLASKHYQLGLGWHF